MEHQNHVQGVQLITRVLGLLLVLFFRFLLICQLEGLELAFDLKGFLGTSEQFLRAGLRSQVCGVLTSKTKNEFQDFRVFFYRRFSGNKWE